MENIASIGLGLPRLEPKYVSLHQPLKVSSHNQSNDNSRRAKPAVEDRANNQQFLKELSNELVNFVEEVQRLENQTNEPVHFKKLAERFEFDSSRQLIKVLVPEPFVEGKSQNYGTISADKLIPKLISHCHSSGKLVTQKNILAEIARINTVLREKCLTNFQSKVRRCVASITDKQRQLYDKNQTPERLKYREYIKEFSVENGSWSRQIPLNERLRSLEFKYSRFANISRSLLEQDHILSEAIRAKSKARPSFLLQRLA